MELHVSGRADVALAVGFEKMAKGSLESMGYMDDRTQPIEKHIDVISSTYGLVPAPLMAQIFANAGREHMEKYGTWPDFPAFFTLRPNK